MLCYINTPHYTCVLTHHSYFGPLHKHGWMPHPKNGPEEFVIVYDSKEYVVTLLPCNYHQEASLTVFQ